MTRLAALLLTVGLLTTPAIAQDPAYYRLLSRDTTGAAAFTEAHPSWDGRGVVIAVLDTGVDSGVPGLLKTSTGEPKVIEARDFTGEGDVTLTEVHETTEEGVAVLRLSGEDVSGVVRGYGALDPPPPEGATLWLGFFTEHQLNNSAVSDLNRDGRDDGTFAVLAWRRADGVAVAAVDTDGDGDLADEIPRRSFADQRERFSFTNPDPRKNQSPVAITQTVLLDESPPRVELHFDDGGHGTHCAGIAAGYRIQGREGFDGLAPGAQLMSLKIGHGALSGGATVAGSMKAAITFASDWARSHRTPVVMNLSYGIDSEIEGQSDIDQALDAALADNRWLVASVSAGNSGPGLSTVGTPAAARLAWTAGALLNRENAEALYGSHLDADKIFTFSSRGGELAKPDGLTPGVAWSTVPPFLDRSVMAGTSMAAPQATGIHALLISAALAEGVPWTSGKLKRALRTSAKPLAGYASVDQGAGLVRVGEAWKALVKQRRHPTGELIVDWRVETAIPSSPGDEGTASYWRVGRYLPDTSRPISVTVTPTFFGDVSDADKVQAFDELSLHSDTSWLSVDRRSLALRGQRGAKLKLTLSPKRLRDSPGLHVGHVIARVAGVEAFRVPVVVVVPSALDAHHHQRFEGRLRPADFQRHFIEVPPGATSLRARLKTPEGRFGATWLLAHDPAGRQVHAWSHLASSERGQTAELLLSGDALRPGVWELDTYTSFRAPADSYYTLDVRFFGVEHPTELAYHIPDGGRPEVELTLVNRFDDAFFGAATARRVGMTRTRTLKISGSRHKETITLGADSAGAELWLTLDPKTYNRFTDVAVNVLDAAGTAVAQDGFGTRYAHLEFDGAPGPYTLEIVGATTDADDDLEWEVELRELQRAKTPAPLTVEAPQPDGLALYPQVPTTLKLTASAPFHELPDGFSHQLEVQLVARGAEPWLEIPLVLTR